MSRIYPLYSSSSGNCTYIGSRAEGILVDCGVSFAKVKSAFEKCGISTEAVRAVFVTHSHSDHTKGLRVLSKKLNVPVFARTKTMNCLVEQGMVGSMSEDIVNSIELSFCKVTPFETSHDTEESCGYRIDFNDGSSCAVCTDLGFVSEEVANALTGCKAVLVESNYDEEILKGCRYPEVLKERIRSDTGHLSNSDCARLCGKLIPTGTEKFILGHISKESNTAKRAIDVNLRILGEMGFVRNRDYVMTAADPYGENSEFTAF